MRINELLSESTELKSTINAVSTDIGNTTSNLYHRLEILLQHYVKRNQSSDGFWFVAGGEAARWMANNGDRLNSELHNLAKQSGNKGQELQKYLLLRHKGFFKLASNLPRILIDLGKRLNSELLVKNASRWEAEHRKLKELVNSYDDSQEIDKDISPSVTATKKPNIHSQQNASAELIVNNILKNLPSNISGDIRNAISKSGNKLLALQHELEKRKIQLAEAKTSDDIFRQIASLDAILAQNSGATDGERQNAQALKGRLQHRLDTEFPGAKPSPPSAAPMQPSPQYRYGSAGSWDSNFWANVGKAAADQAEREKEWKKDPEAKTRYFKDKVRQLKSQRSRILRGFGDVEGNQQYNDLSNEIDRIMRNHLPDDWKEAEAKREKQRQASYKAQQKKYSARQDKIKTDVKNNQSKGQGTFKEVGKEYEDVLKKFHNHIIDIPHPMFRAYGSNAKFGKFKTGASTLHDLSSVPVGDIRRIWTEMPEQDQNDLIAAVQKVMTIRANNNGYTEAQKKKILDAMRLSKAAPRRDYEADRLAREAKRRK